MEIMDIVDLDDQPIGQAKRDRIYKEKLPHRITHVLIFNDKGEMALQLRSKKVSFCPNHWSTTVGGHVQSGESYEEAAIREMEEEIGVKLPLEYLYKEFYEGEGLNKFLGVFKSTYNGPFKPDPKDVESVDYFRIEEIRHMVEKGEKFHPELLFILKKHFFGQEKKPV